MQQLASEGDAARAQARDFGEVLSVVSTRKRIPLRLLSNHSRCRAATARARQLAMYLSHTVYGHTMAEVADFFGRDRTTVSHACALIEDMRDDASIDAEIIAMEQELLSGLAGESQHAH